MKRIVRIAVFAAMSLFAACCTFSGCNTGGSDERPRREVSSYEEIIKEVDLPLKLGIDCDYAEIEVYSWEKKQVKCEVTRRIRGTADKAALEEKLEKLRVDVKKEDKLLSLKGKCDVGPYGNLDSSTVIRLYIPKRVAAIDCTFINGRIRFYDDIDSNIKICARSADVEINRLEGRLIQRVEEGCTRVSAGELETGTEICTGKGNIAVAASFTEGGTYVFDTERGMLKLKVPQSIDAVFEYSGEESGDYSEKGKTARFKLRSGIGEIEIIRT